MSSILAKLPAKRVLLSEEISQVNINFVLELARPLPPKFNVEVFRGLASHPKGGYTFQELISQLDIAF